jgi:hypothetical protein
MPMRWRFEHEDDSDARTVLSINGAKGWADLRGPQCEYADFPLLSYRPPSQALAVAIQDPQPQSVSTTPHTITESGTATALRR